MNVVITIPDEGYDREAIPVRALPFVSSPLTPDRIAEGLASGSPLCPGGDRPLLQGLRAYFLEDGRPVEIPENSWVRFVRAIGATGEELPRDPDYRDGIKLLPAGVFVWKADFEIVFQEIVPAAPGAPKNPPLRVACYEPLMPADMRAIVMEGLVQFVRQPSPTAPCPTPDGVTVLLPHRTNALEALFRVMWENWRDYDPRRKPKQVNIAHAIDEAMGWNIQSDGSPSRNAKALAALIKPDGMEDE